MTDTPIHDYHEPDHTIPPFNPPGHTAILPSHIDSTMMNSFRACPRKFYHEFLLGLRSKTPSIHLHAGAALASALERFYTAVFIENKPTGDAKVDCFNEFVRAWGKYPYEVEGEDARPSEKLKSFYRMWDAIEAYIQTYPPHTDHVQPYKTEEGYVTSEFSFAVPLDMPGFPRHPETGEPFIYCGRFDMLGSMHGVPVVRDEKTGTQLQSTWADSWNTRSQGLGYLFGAAQFGLNISTVVYRGIIITAKETRFPEAIKTYPNYMVERWLEQLRVDLHLLCAMWKRQFFSYNFGDTCTSYGRICQYQPLCISHQPHVWMNDFVISRWNPILRNQEDDRWQQYAFAEGEAPSNPPKLPILPSLPTL